MIVPQVLAQVFAYACTSCREVICRRHCSQISSLYNSWRRRSQDVILQAQVRRIDSLSVGVSLLISPAESCPTPKRQSSCVSMTTAATTVVVARDVTSDHASDVM